MERERLTGTIQSEAIKQHRDFEFVIKRNDGRTRRVILPDFVAIAGAHEMSQGRPVVVYGNEGLTAFIGRQIAIGFKS